MKPILQPSKFNLSAGVIGAFLPFLMGAHGDIPAEVMQMLPWWAWPFIGSIGSACAYGLGVLGKAVVAAAIAFARAKTKRMLADQDPANDDLARAANAGLDKLEEQVGLHVVKGK